MNEGDLISLGVIVSVHGLKGCVKVKTYSGKADNLSADSFLLIKKSTGDWLKLKIKKVQSQKENFIVSFYGIESIEEALPLEKAIIFKERCDLVETEEDEYYFVDLLGCSVYSLQGDYLGKINEIIETGASPVISVKLNKRELLLPFIKDVIKEVNIVEKRLIVDARGYLDED